MVSVGHSSHIGTHPLASILKVVKNTIFQQKYHSRGMPSSPLLPLPIVSSTYMDFGEYCSLSFMQLVRHKSSWKPAVMSMGLLNAEITRRHAILRPGRTTIDKISGRRSKSHIICHKTLNNLSCTVATSTRCSLFCPLLTEYNLAVQTAYNRTHSPSG